MNARWQAVDVIALAVRWFVGGLFIFMGLTKAMVPVEFLKLVRQYGVFDNHLALNFVASALPWFEVFCGVLLILGIAVRGTALMVLAMLVPFTILIWMRALGLQETRGGPFCAIKFDCGCGAGEVFVCRKLAENAVLIVIGAGLIFWRNHRWGLRPELMRKHSISAQSSEVSSMTPVPTPAQQRRPTA